MEHVIITCLQRNPGLSQIENDEASLFHLRVYVFAALFPTWQGPAGGSCHHEPIENIDIK